MVAKGEGRTAMHPSLTPRVWWTIPPPVVPIPRLGCISAHILTRAEEAVAPRHGAPSLRGGVPVLFKVDVVRVCALTAGRVLPQTDPSSAAQQRGIHAAPNCAHEEQNKDKVQIHNASSPRRRRSRRLPTGRKPRPHRLRETLRHVIKDGSPLLPSSPRRHINTP